MNVCTHSSNCTVHSSVDCTLHSTAYLALLEEGCFFGANRRNCQILADFILCIATRSQPHVCITLDLCADATIFYLPVGPCKPAAIFSKALREPSLTLLVLLTCYWSVHFLAFMTCTSVHPSQHVQATYAKVSRISGCLFR
jgi:hypothetical protein